MRWRGREESDNIEDRRGQRGGGMRFPFPMGRGGGGGGGRRGGFSLITLLIIGAVYLFFGGNLGGLLGGGGGGGTGSGLPGNVSFPKLDRQAQQPSNPFDMRQFPRLDREQPTRSGEPNVRQTEARDDMKRFLAVVLRDTEKVWTEQFARLNRRYQPPRLVLFSGFTRTGCGGGQAAMGPFYCPLDQKIYVDTSFFDELKQKFGARGDFAQAYVIAHEVGHHVQTLWGIAEKVQRAKQGMSRSNANRIQVRMELQADCLAGVWAKNADDKQRILEEGDIEEALNAAAAIGDDRIQRRTQGYVVKDSFTHGTSEQRSRWFYSGYKTGDMASCDTFNRRDL